MVKLKLAILACLLLAIPSSMAQIAGHGDSTQDCSQETLIGLLGVTSAGNIEACFYAPRTALTATDQFDVSAILTAPAATGAGTSTLTSTFTLSGCTAGTQTNGGPGGTGFGTQFRTRLHITMASEGCDIILNLAYKNGAGTTLYDADFVASVLAVDAFTRQESHFCNSNLASCSIANVALCNASDATATNSCKDPDSRVFLCAASTADPLQPTSCVTPTINDNLSGSALPDFVNQAFWTLCLATMLGLAIFLLQLHDPGAKILSGSIAALAGFMAFNTSGSLLFRAPFIFACFGTMAYAYFRAANSLMNDDDPLKDIGEV